MKKQNLHLYLDTGVHYKKLASSTDINYLCKLMQARIDEGIVSEKLLISSAKNVTKNRFIKLDLEL